MLHGWGLLKELDSKFEDAWLDKVLRGLRLDGAHERSSVT